MEKQKLTQKTWFTVIMLIIIWPFGLYLMWKNKKFNKVARIIVSVVIVLIVFAQFENKKEETVNTVAEATTNEESKIEEVQKEEVKEEVKEEAKKEEEIEYTQISSTDLIASYKDNQVKCKQLYDGKDLEVTGSVTSVGTDILDTVYVCLGSDGDEYAIVGIQCYAKDKYTENAIAELSEGDVITVRGKGECGSLSFSIRKAEIIK